MKYQMEAEIIYLKANIGRYNSETILEDLVGFYFDEDSELSLQEQLDNWTADWVAELAAQMPFDEWWKFNITIRDKDNNFIHKVEIVKEG